MDCVRASFRLERRSIRLRGVIKKGAKSWRLGMLWAVRLAVGERRRVSRQLEQEL